MASSLQRELKKKGAFESLEQEAMLNILRTNDQFQNRFGRLFREYRLTPSQYNLLRILRGEGKPLPSLEVADRMIQVVPAITGRKGIEPSYEQKQFSEEERRNRLRLVASQDAADGSLLIPGRPNLPVEPR